MLVSLTVGKVDAGVAVLLTQDNRLIEFPSVLLPDNIASGSIVDITVSRNHSAEAVSAATFKSLQKRILNTYGLRSPSPPALRLRNATQTSLVLEWDPIDLAAASLRSLSLYRNGSKAGSIPRPLETRSTKISGLAIHTEYSFHLVLRTSAGTYSSEELTCRTHKMTDLSGITVTTGILHPQQRDALAAALDRIGGKLIDTVRIDTTHFVCTEGRGPLWEKAVEMNIPVVKPEWVDACETEGTIVGVRNYYLDADPKGRQMRPTLAAAQHQHTASSVPSTPANGAAESHPSPQISPALTATERRGSLNRQPSAPVPGAGDADKPVPPEPAPPAPPAKDGQFEHKYEGKDELSSVGREEEATQPSGESSTHKDHDQDHGYDILEDSQREAREEKMVEGEETDETGNEEEEGEEEQKESNALQMNNVKHQEAREGEMEEVTL